MANLQVHFPRWEYHNFSKPTKLLRWFQNILLHAVCHPDNMDGVGSRFRIVPGRSSEDSSPIILIPENPPRLLCEEYEAIRCQPAMRGDQEQQQSQCR